jgi:hypothetical protein
VFERGDKVCCTRNGRVALWCPEEPTKTWKEDSKQAKQEACIRLCNGEIFFITNVRTFSFYKSPVA